MYPEYLEVNGKEYKIDTDFKTALKCFEVIEDETITDYERALAVIYLLLDYYPKNEKEIPNFLDKIKYYLQCGIDIEEQKARKQDMDLILDKKYIFPSFLSDYHVDLSKETMHFWQFVECLEGLKEDCILNRVREIRNYDLSQEKDAKRRKEIIEAKKLVALPKKEKILDKEREKEINRLKEIYGLRRN